MRSLDAPTIYEVYVRSHADTTGSGEGDLNGVTRNLGRIRDLGVDAIWLTPFYPSPMDDGGYDVTDHRAVDPRYGTLGDFDRLVATAHEKGLAVLVDLVFNHTSSEHPWFQAALDGDEAAAERYVFHAPKADGTVPNNWLSFFGPPAWTWAHRRQEYYLHQFLQCQPSLDLRHPEVQADHERTCRFWCDRGVDGFRLDAITAYLFDESMADNPPAEADVRAKIDGHPASPYRYQDHAHDLLPGDGWRYACKIRDWAGSDKWLMGECNSGNRSVEIARNFTGPDRLDAVYTTDLAKHGERPETYVDLLARLEGDWVLPWWLSCHDQTRAVSSLAGGDPAAARFFALLLATLPGPVMLYQGDELGLPQPSLRKAEINDPFDLLYWPDGPGRAGARVPLPWTEDAPLYGFTEAEPWMPMRWPAGLSVAAQSGVDGVPAFWRAALDLRRRAGFARPETSEAVATGDVLDLTIGTASGTYLARFNFGPAAAEAPAGAPCLATGEGPTLARWHGAVVRR